jgi:DMSO/TMAO reductase YedYZ molybdopterin-dependent catalytic subunit
MKAEKTIARRRFLMMAGGALFMGNATRAGYAYFVKELQERTVEKNRFTFDHKTGLIDWETGKKEDYRLHIDGLVKQAKFFSYQDLRSIPQTRQVADFHCVEGWSVPDIRWGGFRFGEILQRIEVKPQASHVVFHSLAKTNSSPKGQDHYIESFPISELVDSGRRIMLVLDMNQKPLPVEHGAPLRLIAPYDLGYKSIKYVTRIEFTEDARPGWWTLANPIYAIEARVPQNRLRKND